MKILLFTTLYPNVIQENHGIFVEKRLLELIKRYPVQAKVLAPVPWYPRWLAKLRQLPEYHLVPRKETRAGIEIEHPRYPVIPGISWRVAPLFLYWFAKGTARRLHKQFSFDLVDAHFAFPDGAAAGMLAHDLNVPYLITARGSDINDSPNFWLPKRFLQKAFESAAHMITVSKRLKTKVEALGVDRSKVSVLPNGVDLDIFKPVDKPNVAAEYGVRAPFILSVGSLRELKGHHLVIQALEERKDLQGYSLLIAGTGTMKSSLQDLIRTLQMNERIKLIGEVPNENLPALYSAASLFVLASSNEGCPNVVLEALACGTPVVASDVGAVPELLPEEFRQFMITERSVKEIGKQITACLSAEMPANLSREKALALGWDETCKSLHEIMSAIKASH